MYVFVLYRSWANLLQIPGTQETTCFVRIFDRAFDYLNVRNLSEWREKRKPDRKPYESPSDERLQVPD